MDKLAIIAKCLLEVLHFTLFAQVTDANKQFASNHSPLGVIMQDANDTIAKP